MRSFTLLLLLYVTSTAGSFSQDSTFTFQGRITAAASSANTPLWLHANQYGSVPYEGSFLSAQLAAHKVYNPGNPRFFQWSGGFEMIANAGKKSSAFFTDVFLAGKIGNVEVGIGQKKNQVGLTDTLLTSGSLALSANARPYPRIWIASAGFMNLIPGNDFISFNFAYSDGLLGSADINFGNVTHVPATYLHHKMLYLKLGGAHQRLNLYGGFNHQAMWGGEDLIFSDGLKKPEAYKYVVFGKPWAHSRVGNHFGTIDLGAEWKGESWTLFLYRQSIYEDGSLIDLSNIADGLAGIRLKSIRKQANQGLHLNAILLEYAYTKNQGGAIFDFNTGTFGRDNYYNHYIYNQGWSFRGRTLGTPLIAPQASMRDDLKIPIISYTSNNRVSAFHAGADLSWQDLNVTLKGTFSNNIGLYKAPFESPVNQASLFIQAELPVNILGRSHVSVVFAGDYGKLFPASQAIMIGWRRAGYFR
ncbi:capsule assembly Wzi family protein [Dyadobacter sandarakinus]|uniref:Capsule assembly protein Wzi n=1 Tax=Dyadobacter sandarakinus TaxID=2747268 RepID=A0ABX7IC40_9BACT|nr:capsule assembly Wzi family protein [Dyadobacter sandarakinus]QRR03385.1 hypothetical protein HWI92_21975 [Dyadobacter sandarakinus]